MVGRPRWLSLEVQYLDRARSFYEEVLDLDVVREAEREVVLDIGGGDGTDEDGAVELRLRAPGDVPRGGVHVHYALSVPREEYDDWYDRLDDEFDLELTEHQFGENRSLYCFDPDGHCVELGESDVAGPGVDGLFEVVLEVEDLDATLDFYRRLGFEVTDRGGKRRRVRTTTGDVDLELWEPQLGLADARGGVHVDWGVGSDDASTAARRVAGDALAVESVDEGIRVRDPDGHYLTLC